MTSQLVARQGTVADVSPVTRRETSETVYAMKESRKAATPEVQGEVTVQTVDEIDRAVLKVNEYLEAAGRGLRFSFDDSSGRTVVQVVDTETDDVIKQIPSEEMLTVIRNIRDITGNIIDKFT